MTGSLSFNALFRVVTLCPVVVSAHSTLSTDCLKSILKLPVFNYDRVLLMNVVPPPTPQPVLQTTTLTPTPSIYNPWLVFVHKTTVLNLIIPNIFV